MTTKPEDMRITYTSGDLDWDLFHRYFDEALADLKSRFGQVHTGFINGEPVISEQDTFQDTTPIDTSVVLGEFQSLTPKHLSLIHI